MNHKFIRYVKYNYVKKIKSKAFIGFNIFLILMSILISQVPKIIEFFNDQFDYSKVIIVQDDTDAVLDIIEPQLLTFDSNLEIKEVTDYSKEIEEKITNGDYLAYLHINYTQDQLIEAEYKAFDMGDQSLYLNISTALQNVHSQLAFNTLGLNEQQQATLQKTMDIEVVTLDENAESVEEEMTSFSIMMAGVTFIFFFSYMYGVNAGQEVMEEKTTRAMEIIITSISPIKQLYGKIIYNIMFALTQFIILILLGTIGIIAGIKNVPVEYMDVVKSSISSDMISSAMNVLGWFSIFAIVALLLYTITILILSSVIVSIEEYQMAISPLMIIGIAAFYLAIFGINMIDSPFMMVMSYVPFFSIYLMPMQIVSNNVTTIEILISLLINLTFIVLLIKVGANIYKNGILNYSGGNVFKKMFKAIKKQ